MSLTRLLLLAGLCLGSSLALFQPPARAADGAAALPRPVLAAESVETGTRLFVESALPDGRAIRRLLRDTAAAVVPGATGRDPAGGAAFAVWTEDALPWSAWSRDAGATWSEPAPLEVDLRLHDGATPPGRRMPPAPRGFDLPAEARLFLVQFRTIGLPEWRAALRDAGAEVLAHFPHNAHVVRMTPELRAQVAALDFVERVEPYEPWYRIEEPLRAWAREPAAAGAGEEKRVRALAFEWGPEGKGRIARAAERLGARVATYWPSGHVLELVVDREQLRRLAAHDDVLWIDRWSEPEVDMDLVREDAGDNWLETNFGSCGQGVRGEVLDSGIQDTHPDFDGILLHGQRDIASHGTSTYGIVFGNGARDGDGNAQATGHMPCAEQGIFADFGFLVDRFAHTQELKAAPYFASFQSNSWGNSLTTAYNSFSFEMDDIIWRLDIAITQSQSNTGNQSSRPEAWAKNVISVGGIRHRNTLSTADDAWEFDASIGPAADGRVKPDVCYWNDSIFTTTTGSGYTTSFNGTSAATPEVAGVLGLMVQEWAENVWGTDPQGDTVFEKQPHFSTIKALLINNSQQYPFSGATHDLTRTHQGWGRPSVRLARDRAAASLVVDETQPLQVGQTAVYKVDVASGETELKVSLVYPDPPGTTSATLHRINDLSLRVTSPSSAQYHGNVGLDVGTASTSGGAPNGIDTVENVFVPSPAAGRWTVEVTAAEINQDAHLDTPAEDAVFALVVTGATGLVQTCGNGDREPVEECDGTDLGGLTCADLGCTGGGALACTAGCFFDASGCSGCPPCGDGECEQGESCHRCPADCISESIASCGNDLCEIADGEDCLSCPGDCNGKQSGSPSTRYCCGDGEGDTPVGCADPRCDANGNTCVDLPSLAYCCGDGQCDGAETPPTCGADCTVIAPGEAAPPLLGQVLVTGFEPGTGVLSLDYRPACAATGHVIEYGPLTAADVSSYNWTGQQCGLDASGVYDWTTPASPASLFFVVVGTDGVAEGSYGRDALGAERPEDATSTTCPLPQNLAGACE